MADIINDKEYSAAEEAAKADTAYTYTHTFGKPFEFEGESYKELTFDWGNLTGKDALAIESEMTAMGKPVIVATFSGEYLIRMAAKACTVPIGSDAFLAMPISDYNKIRTHARNFLMRSEL